MLRVRSENKRFGVVLGFSSTGIALHIPVLLARERIDYCIVLSRDSEGRTKKYQKVTIHMENGKTKSFSVIGTEITDEIQTVKDLERVSNKMKSKIVVVSLDNPLVKDVMQNASLVVACSRDGVSQYVNAFINSKIRQHIDVVDFDNAIRTYNDWKKGLEDLKKVSVFKGIVHCVVPKPIINSAVTELDYYPKTSQPYVVYPPGLSAINRRELTSNYQNGYTLIVAGDTEELEYHRIRKAGLNISHQLMCSVGYMTMSRQQKVIDLARTNNRSVIDEISEKTFSELYSLMDSSYRNNLIKDICMEFYKCYLEPFEENANSTAFLLETYNFLTHDLIDDKIGRGLRNIDKFSDYEEFYNTENMPFITSIIEAMKSLFTLENVS